MVWAIAVVLGVLWAIVMANDFTAGGYVHLVLVAAIALIAYGLYRHRRTNRRNRRSR